MTDDVVYEVTSKYENRPDLLAYELYGDSALWWVFAVRNKNTIKDPIYDLVAGTKIYIPRLSTLKTNLGI
jgi:prophage DNA circulation protein